MDLISPKLGISVDKLLEFLFSVILVISALFYRYLVVKSHEPLYPNSAFIACWFSQRVHMIVYPVVKNDNNLVNSLLLKIFIANYYYL